MNPLKFIGAGLNAISLAGKGLGKAQKLFAALSEDKDKDGTPEYKEAANGLVKIFHKAKDDSLPKFKGALIAFKAHLAEYKKIFSEEVIPNVISVFDSARKVALEE
jgi:hypothetical protein